MNIKKIGLLLVIAALIGAFFMFDLGSYLSLDYIKGQQDALQGWVADNQLLAVAAFMLIYIAVTALSLPGAAVMTLAGGAVFGLFSGLIMVSFASSIGATLAFLMARYLFREPLTNKFSSYIEPINRGIEKDGISYLFTLRLVPLFPFFVINAVLGLTRMKAKTFYWVSQLGMLPGTVIFVNAGTQLAAIEQPGDILSPGLILSFCLLGIFPWIAKAIVSVIQRRKVYSGFTKPTQFDTNMVVIGAGAGGLVTSYIAAATKAKVTLIERHKMGGDCLNTGCVPSKALIRTTHFLADVRDAGQLGIRNAEVEYDFAEVMERVQRVIKTIEPHDSIERYESLGVDCVTGEARILSPWEVEVNGSVIKTQNIVIATGARPAFPDIPGLDKVEPLTSDTIWELRQRPDRLLVLGAGAIGCELGQCFARLGTDVSIMFRGSQVLTREDQDAAAVVEQRLLEDGVNICAGHTPVRFEVTENGYELVCRHNNQEKRIGFDKLLVATGRTANVTGFGLEELGITAAPGGTIEVDDYLRTRIPNILACGDVIGPYQFTHAAAHQAWYASVNGLFGMFKKFKVDYSFIPFTTYTSPEVARIGLNEKQAIDKGIQYEAVRYNLEELDRAITDEAAYGFVKVLLKPGSDKIIGVTLVGEHAAEMLPEFALAMKHKLGLNKILGTTHAYPTLNEANRFVAGEWKKKHAPQKVLQWLEKFHAWKRG
ncbi:FAD-dependent oxidoreductase [Amphritea balenae]|uniref:Pyridine nucleotide-disulfide oxidoreductase n=1 Tax=Amphritea balenae TaxID=452629 RepID=A0A3P1SLA3_9GAMM|nr:bifunctional TVP38/TMEM64 family protein/FAD-dependent oxidoreductase [Amphritea balenae]RRC97062.1 pyridine nucleotide-disulfide oxidoreductase [Amphritea balenae]GGK67654.1 pyridine nucleotide-disulfide oxidoreductase [Amphritea balenae]